MTKAITVHGCQPYAILAELLLLSSGLRRKALFPNCEVFSITFNVIFAYWKTSCRLNRLSNSVMSLIQVG